jgi:hypothetical protein
MASLATPCAGAKACIATPLLKSHHSHAEQLTELAIWDDMTYEWHIQIEQRYLDPVAGAGARAKEQQLASEKGTTRRFLERLFDARTEDRSWRRGAEGADRPTEPAERSSGGSVTIRRWKRYGKDRLYANGADGLRLGYLEVATGEIVLEVADPTGTIAAQLRASRRALGGTPTDANTRG